MRHLRRYDSPPEVHAQSGERDAASAEAAVGDATRAYARGDCLTAGKRIDDAYYALGAGYAHSVAEGRRTSGSLHDRLTHAERGLKAIDSKFERTCVRKKPTRR